MAGTGGVARSLGGPGFDVVETAAKSIARHRMLVAGDKVVVGVSGGADSMCLLDVIVRLSDKLDFTPAVAHIDHGISDDSALVAARVANHAASLGLEVHVTRAPDLAGPNLQARAREFRYGFFEIVASREGAAAIATGHTLDDRVETTLARLLHGAPTEGLAGIRPVEGSRIRPLLELRRSETRAYCDEIGIDTYDDPANADERFERVGVRNRLVAAVETGWGDGAIRAIARSAERLAEDADALDALADRLYADAARGEHGEVSFETPAMLALSTALRRRLLQKAVGRVRDRHGGIDEALEALKGGGAIVDTKRFAVASGAEIAISPEVVRVTRPAD